MLLALEKALGLSVSSFLGGIPMETMKETSDSVPTLKSSSHEDSDTSLKTQSICQLIKVILNSPKGCCLILTESFVLCAWFWVVFYYKWNIKWLVLTIATLAKQHKKLCQGKVWRVTRKGQSEMHHLNVTIFLKKQKNSTGHENMSFAEYLILGSRWTIVKALI